MRESAVLAAPRVPVVLGERRVGEFFDLLEWNGKKPDGINAKPAGDLGQDGSTHELCVAIELRTESQVSRLYV